MRVERVLVEDDIRAETTRVPSGRREMHEPRRRNESPAARERLTGCGPARVVTAPRQISWQARRARAWQASSRGHGGGALTAPRRTATEQIYARCRSAPDR